jgi:hypothetical protein
VKNLSDGGAESPQFHQIIVEMGNFRGFWLVFWRKGSYNHKYRIFADNNSIFVGEGKIR